MKGLDLIFVEKLAGPSLCIEWTNWSNIFEVTQICIPLLLLGSSLILVILKESPPHERAELVLFCRNCVRIYVWSLTYAWNGPIGLKN